MLRVAVVLFSCYVLFNRFPAEGINLSNAEDIEVERHLALINKYTLKTIKTEDGDVYNCVDIHNQPALHHPLLKDHKIQMRRTLHSNTTSKPLASVSSSSSPKNIIPSFIPRTPKIGLKNGCPQGTVPIRKTTKEEMLRAKSSFRRFHQDDRSTKEISEDGILCYARYASEHDLSVHNVGGISAYISIYNPNVTDKDFSSALIRVQRGDPNNLESIEAGWQVAPLINGDKRTRMFVSMTTIDSNGSVISCINTQCSAYVHVHSHIPVDMVFSDISVPLGAQFDMKFELVQDPNMNWWLTINGTEDIGYWPKPRLSRLPEGADFTTFGGLVYGNDVTSGVLPQMGSGSKDYDESDIFHRNAYFRNLKSIIYGGGRSIIRTENNNELTYTAWHGYLHDDDDFWGFAFLFGGPGSKE